MEIQAGSRFTGIAAEISALNVLRKQGGITEEEFTEAKKRLLDIYPPALR